MWVELLHSDFDPGRLYERLRGSSVARGAGAIVTFTGLVREFNSQGAIEGIELEHYPGMTESALEQLLDTAMARFSLLDAAIVHRVGRIANHEQIVWVGSAAQHRQAAFDGACFMMDTLKQAVPLWKKEYQRGRGEWVEAKHSDQQAAMKWLSEGKNQQ